MGEEVTQVTVQKTNKRCPKCKIGYLTCIEPNKTSLFKMYTHSCSGCSKTTLIFDKKYPIIG